MFNNKGAATTFAILAMTGMLGFGGYKGCSKTEIKESAKFTQGTCVIDSRKEAWVTELAATFRIDSVGKTKYLVTYFYERDNRTYTTDYTMWMIDDYYVETNCPNELRGF